MEQWFEDKVALVTGAGDGIGRAAAILFAKRGARVVVTDVNRETGNQTVELIRGNGGTAIFADGDVTDGAQIAAFVQTALDQFGSLDCAFNNAGITHPRDVEWDDDAWLRTLNVNLKGVRDCIKYQLKMMLQTGGGTIVNTASTAGFVGSVHSPTHAYVASKHAVVGLTKSVALEYARRNIRVNAVAPGTTITNMVRDVMASSEEIKQWLENYAPMGRMAAPEEIAEAAIWLSSEKSSYVTGQTIVIDGGHLAH